jgi:hypothetical protein
MAEGRAIWVYAVAPVVRREWFGAGDGVDCRPVWPVMADGFAAAVSGVSLDGYGPEAIATRAEDPGWLTETARRHQTVIAKIAEQQPVVPMPLATLCPDEASVVAYLTERHGDLSRAIDRAAPGLAGVPCAGSMVPGGETGDGAPGYTRLVHSSRVLLADPRRVRGPGGRVPAGGPDRG